MVNLGLVEDGEDKK